MKAFILTCLVSCMFTLSFSFGGDDSTDGNPICSQAVSGAPIVSARIIQTVNPNWLSRFWRHTVLRKNRFIQVLEVTYPDGTVKRTPLGVDGPESILFHNTGAIGGLRKVQGAPVSANLELGLHSFKKDGVFYLYFELPVYSDLYDSYPLTTYLVFTISGDYVGSVDISRRFNHSG